MRDHALHQRLFAVSLLGLGVMLACLNDAASCHYPPLAAYLPCQPPVLRPAALW